MESSREWKKKPKAAVDPVKANIMIVLNFPKCVSIEGTSAILKIESSERVKSKYEYC